MEVVYSQHFNSGPAVPHDNQVDYKLTRLNHLSSILGLLSSRLVNEPTPSHSRIRSVFERALREDVQR